MSQPRFLLALLWMWFGILPCTGTFATETDSEKKMQWWHDAKFGMFIHWGVYAVPAGMYEEKPVDGIGEWIMHSAHIPVSTYKEYAKQFDAAKYDPEAWAELAKQAGMKYVVITSKHHDGFALYDSAVTDWDIVDSTAYGKDALMPLAAAVRKQGLKFGLYYSQAQDWVHPGGGKAGYEEGGGWDDAQKGDFDAYLKKIAEPQTDEILARFKPDVLWWDTQVWMTHDRAKPLHDRLAAYPNIITNDRLGGDYPGDTKTPEQHIPETGLPGNWETCMTLNDTWGYKSTDHNWKSVETLIHNLVDIVSKGGNYLLNVGPTPEGEIPRESIERLQAVGKWMGVNGEAIYGTIASPCRAPSWGRVTKKGNNVYLCMFDWPSNDELIVPITATVKECYLLAAPSRRFKSSNNENGLTLTLSGEAPDKICSVIVLECDGNVKGVVPLVRQAEDGTLELSIKEAEIKGKQARVEQIAGQASIGYWTDPADQVEWQCLLSAGGEFEVSAELAVPSECRFEVQSDGASLATTVSSTGGYDKFQTVDLGHIKLSKTGKSVISILPDAHGWQAINLRRLVLKLVR